MVLPQMVAAAQKCLPNTIEELEDLRKKASKLQIIYSKLALTLEIHLKQYNDSLVIDDEFYRLTVYFST